MLESEKEFGSIVTMEDTLEKPKEVVKKASGNDIEKWLRITYPGTVDTKMQIRSLWENYYRINYWGKKVIVTGKKMDHCVVESIFCKVIKKGDSFDLVRFKD